VSRGSALVNPAGDDTSSWRLDLWTSNLARWRQHLLAGEGLGSYYAANADRGVATTTQPHSYYVQTLVSMGAIGLALLLAVVVVAGAALWNALKRERNVERMSLDATLVEAGLGILLSALAYSAVYAVDYYPCLWVGLALAAAMGLRRTEPPATAHPLSRPWMPHAPPPRLPRR
jgi:O-antigen ligase